MMRTILQSNNPSSSALNAKPYISDDTDDCLDYLDDCGDANRSCLDVTSREGVTQMDFGLPGKGHKIIDQVELYIGATSVASTQELDFDNEHFISTENDAKSNFL